MRNAKLPVKPVWQLPFRPLFLLGTLFSCLVLLLWVAQLSGLIHLKTFGPAVTWHAHEMLFGFTMAIVVGFLLTAVRNWTGKPSAMGPALKLMVFLWCLSRFLWLFEQSPIWLVALCDAAFPLYAAYWMAKPLRGAKQPQNQYFVLLLIVLGIGQLVYHLLLNEAVQYISVFQQSMVLVMANLVFWVGGRVLPFFVQAKLSIPKRELPSWLTPAAMTCSWSLIPLLLTQQTILLTVFGVLSALLHTLRLLLFCRWGVLKEPMLWSIFVAPLWIVLGFMALALGSANWLHLITVGGLGGMILSMISRVSLGHSGEPIRALKWMPMAFIFMSIASVTRFFANDIQLFTGAGYTFSALLWVCAFGCFIVHYHKRLLAL